MSTLLTTERVLEALAVEHATAKIVSLDAPHNPDSDSIPLSERIRLATYLHEKLGYIDAYHSLPSSNTSSLSTAELAQTIYAKLTNSRFCKTRPGNPQEFLAVLEAAIAHQQPIRCVLGHGPLKNPNNCSQPYADWAELFAYIQLTRLASAVKALYGPGLEITLYFDDGRSEYANKVDPALTAAYQNSVHSMINALDLAKLIPKQVSLKVKSATDEYESHREQAEACVRQWIASPENASAWQVFIDHARKNLPRQEVPFLEETLQQAAFRYLVGYEMEKRAGFWDAPNTLYMRYSTHEGFYQIFTLRKGSISQPWQGFGALLKHPSEQLEPTVLTAEKQKRCEQITILPVQKILREAGLPTRAVFDLPGLYTLPLMQENSLKNLY